PIPPLLKEDGQPIFRDSWEAEAFAIGNLLIKQGFLTCSEWVEIFIQEIKNAQAKGDLDRGDTYYCHWLNALERLCVERGLTDWGTYQKHLELWHQAVLNTPHGVPLAIENAYREREEDHAHFHHHDHIHGHHHHHHEAESLPENLFTPVAIVNLKKQKIENR
ncbi:MAG: nitrile hydratase accessory protein, partial [Microcystaceae cyanobacterium]